MVLSQRVGWHGEAWEAAVCVCVSVRVKTEGHDRVGTRVRGRGRVNVPHGNWEGGAPRDQRGQLGFGRVDSLVEATCLGPACLGLGSCERECAGRVRAVYVSVPGRKGVRTRGGGALSGRWAVKVSQKQFCFLSD